jgi:hypothetical protein
MLALSIALNILADYFVVCIVALLSTALLYGVRCAVRAVRREMMRI